MSEDTACDCEHGHWFGDGCPVCEGKVVVKPKAKKPSFTLTSIDARRTRKRLAEGILLEYYEGMGHTAAELALKSLGYTQVQAYRMLSRIWSYRRDGTLALQPEHRP
jgi:hypothetical protein